MDTVLKFPFYIKFALISIGAFAFVYSLYIGQQIILPLIYATIIAILLNPLVNFLVRKRINRIVAITVAVLSAVLFTVAVLYFISSQLSMFSETYPALKEKFNETSKHVIQWVSDNFNIKTSKINAWIKQTEGEAIHNLGGTIGQTLSVVTGIVIIVVLLPVYLFMILFYRDLLLEFIRKIFNAAHHDTVFEVLTNSKKIIQSYLTGLLVEAAIVGTLNSVGLLFLGIDYAIILGITGALLNVIPYIGGIIAIALPMIIAYVTKGSSAAILVFGLYLLIQFIDNHFIIPRIVASKVKINALIAVIVILIGGALWGIPGMFLSIPLTAIVKVIFDHIEPLKPWGFLLGNVVPTASKLKFNFIKKKKKNSELKFEQ
ncbi:MAG TPA: AI-2E family transporter [Chitinophagaceae bacterium]|nr:AI-2E family transporter [Chitinophagaceae bacterium]